MSLNTAHANGGVLIYNGEIILLYCDGVELTIDGNNAKDFGGSKKGKIYLTTHRMIFMNKSEKDPLQSFSFPFFSMTSLELEQPVFGANYIKGVVNAQAAGNWVGKATFKLKFSSGGAIEFGQAMLQAAKMASRNMPPQPPPYMPHQGPYYPAQPPAYMPPTGGINGFVPPTHVFPNAPPANSVYTTDMPPPYPGIYPPPYAYPPGSQNYPQAGPTGPVGYPGGPAPAGFNVSNGTAPTAAGPYPSAPAGNPPPYQQQGPPGAAAQYSGATQQPPYNESKSGIPPVYDFYQDPYRQDVLYNQQHMNGYAQNVQGPPPPYSEANKKDQ